MHPHQIVTLITLTPPTTEPVSVAEAKLALRFTGSALDAEIARRITSAREVAEHETGRALMPQTLRLDLTDWPSTGGELANFPGTYGEIVLPTAPIISVTAVEYWSGSAWVTVSNTAYSLEPGPLLSSVLPTYGTTWPTLGNRAGARVRVTFQAGYADAAHVPAAVRDFIIAQAGAWLDNPEATLDQNLVASPLLRGLLDPARLYL